MIKKYTNLSMMFGVPGFILQGFLFVPSLKLLGLLGIALFVTGLVFYAKSVGHYPAWGLLGLLGWFGIIGIMCLRDKTLTQEETAKPKKTSPILIGALLFLLFLIGLGILAVLTAPK